MILGVVSEDCPKTTRLEVLFEPHLSIKEVWSVIVLHTKHTI